MSLSDSEIIESIRGGAKQHFAVLIDRYKDRGLTLGLHMLKNREDAEEALQDAFIRAYNALNRFEGASKFSTWFYRILYNVCLTRLERRKRQVPESSYDDEQFPPRISSTGACCVDTEFERIDMVDYLRSIINDMPAKYSTILSLFYFQDLSHNEICEITQLSLGTVKVHLFRARAILQRRLANEFQKETAPSI